MTAVMGFEEAIRRSGDKRHLLTGNGFSVALKPDIFAYASLYSKTNFEEISEHLRPAFEALSTKDFEVVVRALEKSDILSSIYGADHHISGRMKDDAEALKTLLAATIAKNHPDKPGEITSDQYRHSKSFMSNFECYYIINYDLLLYWTLMQAEVVPDLPKNDGFTSDEEDDPYVVWDMSMHGQNTFYLHGALHIFDAGPEIRKYTWNRTGITLVEQIREALHNNMYPIFVSEGTSSQKLTHIQHSAYLSRCLRSFREIGNSLFTYGFSFSENDSHIINSIAHSKVKKLFVGLYGDPNIGSNKAIIKATEILKTDRLKYRSRTSLEIYFYDAASAQVWG